MLAVAIDPRRLRLVTAGLALAVPVASPVWLASRSDALTHRGSTLGAAADEGHRLALWLVLFMALAAATAVGLLVAERRVEISEGVRRAYAGALALLAVGGVVAVLVAGGGPVHLAKRGYGDFTSNLTTSSNLNSRLFSLSSNGRTQLWHVAWRQFEAHPVLGGGGGSFEQYWNRNRPSVQTSGTLTASTCETLAELGVPGLVLLLGVLAIPFAGFAGAEDSRSCPSRSVPTPASSSTPRRLGLAAARRSRSPGCSAGWPHSSPRASGAGPWCSAHARGAILLGAAGVCAAFTFVALVGNIAIEPRRRAP